jgi:8-oxo-dGTP pyrophosphatase MutT (NUDIX family)
MSELRETIVSVAITDEQSRMFLLHRPDHMQWQLPGGRVRLGESLMEAAARHALEEAGVEAVVLRYLGSRPFEQYDTEYTGEWYKAVAQLGEPDNMDITTYDAGRFMYPTAFPSSSRAVRYSHNVLQLMDAIKIGEVNLYDDRLDND